MRTRDLFEGERPRRLSSIAFPPDARVACLAPHPDDFDAMGIAMRFFRDHGNPIRVAVFSSSSGVEESYCADPTPGKHAAIRDREQRRSCRFFGLSQSDLTFLHLDEDETGQHTASPHNLERLGAWVLAERPDLVFLPHGNDPNTGHQRTDAMARAVAARAHFPITAFLVRDPKTVDMRTDVYAEFGEDDATWKAELLRFHDSQHQRNLHLRGHGFDDRILNVNREVARELGLEAPYAEAFELEFWNQ